MGTFILSFFVVGNFRKETTSLTEANNYLAVHLHKLLSQEDKNVFFSPFSISVAMGMLLCAAEGVTASELRSALGHKNAGIKKKDLPSLFEQQMSILTPKDDSYILSFANSMLRQKHFQVKDEYKKIISDFFKGSIYEVDFAGETESVRKNINSWVSEKTNNMINDFLKCLDPSNVLILLNAVYFKGTWSKQFDKKDTRSGIFYNRGQKNKAKKVDMMHLTNPFPYYKDDTYQALQLPYIGDEMAMLILLPNERDGLGPLEASLPPGFLQDLKRMLLTMKVEITFPRFKLDYEKSLIPSFKMLGVQRVFSSAELPHLTEGSGLFVSEILHRAVLEVNEEGSEAAAVTMIALSRSISRPRRIPEFIADHPFLLVIYNTKNDLILFMARVNEL